MTSYPFKDDRCRKLYEAAYPTKHYKGFAWKESPKTLENHWTKETRGKTEKEKDELLKTCLLAGEAQTKYRIEKERSGESLHRPRGIAVWFNAGDYYSEIGSHAELKEKAASKICIVDGCSEVSDIVDKAGRHYCCHHYCYDESGRLRSNLGLVKEMRAHYKKHKEIHDLRGEAAIKFIKWAIKGVGK